MLYVVIIIVALALAFIILVRRLPKALDTTETKPATPPTQRPEFVMPKFKLPKIALPSITLPTRPPKQSPADSAPTPTKPASTDFWEEPAAPEPAPAPKPTPAPTPIPAPVTAPQPKPHPITPKPRVRDPFQEAEDAFAIKDYKKAERIYLRLATEDPKNAKVYGRLGVIYMEQKNYDDARDALQVAIKLEPNIASRHFNLALTYIQLGSRAKAVTAMEAALKYDPSNRKYRKMLDDILAGRS